MLLQLNSARLPWDRLVEQPQPYSVTINALARQYYAWTAYLYWASLAWYVVPTMYLFLRPVHGTAPLLIVVLMALFLAFLLVVGAQLQTGSKWAQALVLLNAGGMVLLCLYAVPSLVHSTPFTVLRSVTFLALNVAILFFLFKAYRAATQEES